MLKLDQRRSRPRQQILKMQLLNLLKKAQQEGPNEAPVAEESLPKVKRDNNAASKDEEYIAHEDSKSVPAGSEVLAHMRIVEVENEHEHEYNKPGSEQQIAAASDYHFANAEAVSHQIDSPLDKRKRNRFSHFSGGAASRPLDGTSSPIRNNNHDSKTAYRNNNRHSLKKSLDSFTMKKSLERGMQSPHQSSQGPSCIFAPENVENRIHTDGNEELRDSVDNLRPNRLNNDSVHIFAEDAASPVM